jgi:hypothetical protein
MSPEERRAMGGKARDLVLKDFDERNYVSRQADILERLLREKERTRHGIAG